MYKNGLEFGLARQLLNHARITTSTLPSLRDPLYCRKLEVANACNLSRKCSVPNRS